MVNSIRNAGELKTEIARLEEERKLKGQQLKAQLLVTVETLKPVNLIKSTLSDIAQSQEIKESLLKNVIGLAFGMFSKKVLIGSSKGLFKTILGTAIELGAADLVIRNADTIKSFGQKAIQALFKKSNKHVDI